MSLCKKKEKKKKKRKKRRRVDHERHPVVFLMLVAVGVFLALRKLNQSNLVDGRINYW